MTDHVYCFPIDFVSTKCAPSPITPDPSTGVRESGHPLQHVGLLQVRTRLTGVVSAWVCSQQVSYGWVVPRSLVAAYASPILVRDKKPGSFYKEPGGPYLSGNLGL